ncbi:MAG: hypothetical protein ACYTHK_05135 [Planctomycetota bacterium]
MILLLAGCGITVLLLSGCGLTDAAHLLRDAIKPASELEGLVREREETIHGIRVRRYGNGPAILLCHGAVAEGIDDPRFIALARALALRGFEVSTPQLESLCRFRIDIEDPSRIARLAGSTPVALMGISIGGSYCLLAANRPGVNARCVFAFGGYADFEALVMRWLAHPGEGPRELLDPLREGRRRVLQGNRDRLEPQAVEAAMESEQPLSEAAANRLIDPMRKDLFELSPVRQPATPTRVFLLHAENDPVVPTTDSEVLAKHYGNVRVLITDLFGHVDAEAEPGLWEAYPLLSFLADFLRTAR